MWRACPGGAEAGVHTESLSRVPAWEGAPGVRPGFWPPQHVFWRPPWGPGDYRCRFAQRKGDRKGVGRPFCGRPLPDNSAQHHWGEMPRWDGRDRPTLTRPHAPGLMYRSWHQSTSITLLPSSPRLPSDPSALAPGQPGDTGLASHPLPSPVTGSGTDM